MKHVFCATAIAILALATSAHAAQPLTERQMDRVTAGSQLAVADAVASAAGHSVSAYTYTFAMTWTVNPTQQQFGAYSMSESVSSSH